MNLNNRLQQVILPGRILAVQVGLTRTAVLAETVDGIRCGLAATLTNPDFDHRKRPAVLKAGYLNDLSFTELAALIDSPSFTEVAIGYATINALLPRSPEDWIELNAEDHLAQAGQGKNVVVVGHFPFVQRLRDSAQNLWVLELNPREGDLPSSAAPQVLPQADFVAITATALINSTFEGLLRLCKPGSTIMLVGPSTPLSPILYDFGVDLLCGTIVTNPQAALLGIGQGISLHQMREAGLLRLVTLRR